MSGPLPLGHTALPATASGQLGVPVLSLRSESRPGARAPEGQVPAPVGQVRRTGVARPLRLGQGRVKSQGARASAARASECQPRRLRSSHWHTGEGDCQTRTRTVSSAA